MNDPEAILEPTSVTAPVAEASEDGEGLEPTAENVFSDSFDGNLNNWRYKAWDRANQAEIDYGPWVIESGRLSNCTPTTCDRGDSIARRAWTSVATNASGYTIDTDLYLIGTTSECKVIFSNAHRDEAYRVDVMNWADKVRVAAPAPGNMREYPVAIDGNGTGYHLKVVVSRTLVDVYFNRHGGTQQKILSLGTGIFPDGKVGVGTYGGDCDFDNFVVSGTEGVGNGTANLIPVFGYERTEACDEGPYNGWKGERMHEAACDRPLFAPWNRDDQQWWNAMVEEMQRASITTIAAHNRGCYDWDPSGLHGDGDMCPRHLSKLITALRANGSNQKIAMWDDFLTVGSHHYWENNGAPFSFHPSNVASWQKYIWDLRWKVWFDNVPGGDRYYHGGRPVIFMWFPDTNNPAYLNYFAPDAQGNMSQMIEWMRNKVRNAHGVNPFIVINEDMYRADTTLDPANQPSTDRRPDMVYAWFNGADAVNPSPIYSFNGLKAATAVPGFRDKTCVKEGEGGDHVCSGPPGSPGIREIPRHHGHKLIGELEHKKNANFVLLEGWTNIIESAGFYRSVEGNDPRSCTLAGDQNTVDFPNQALSIVHRYMNPNRTDLVLEAETADHYRDDDPGNHGGKYRVTSPGGSSCTYNDLDVGFDGSRYYVGWVSPAELMIFRDVYLPAGTYSITVSYATPQSGARQCVQIGQGQELCSGNLPPTGSWDGTWASAQLGTFTVKKGLVDFKVRFPQGWSNLDKITLTSVTTPTVPAPPSNVTAIAFSGTHIRVAWTDNSSNETGFEIHNGVNIVQVGANATSYLWGGLSPGTYMCFLVRSYNAAGPSGWSPSWTCTTTPIGSDPPSSSLPAAARRS